MPRCASLIAAYEAHEWSKFAKLVYEFRRISPTICMLIDGGGK